MNIYVASWFALAGACIGVWLALALAWRALLRGIQKYPEVLISPVINAAHQSDGPVWCNDVSGRMVGVHPEQFSRALFGMAVPPSPVAVPPMPDFEAFPRCAECGDVECGPWGMSSENPPRLLCEACLDNGGQR